MFGLPVLLVAFAIVMGAAALADAWQDPLGAKCLRWVGAAAAMFLLGDVLLLVGCLGLEVVARRDEEAEDFSDSDSSSSKISPRR